MQRSNFIVLFVFNLSLKSKFSPMRSIENFLLPHLLASYNFLMLRSTIRSIRVNTRRLHLNELSITVFLIKFWWRFNGEHLILLILDLDLPAILILRSDLSVFGLILVYSSLTVLLENAFSAFLTTSRVLDLLNVCKNIALLAYTCSFAASIVLLIRLLLDF